MIRVGCCPQVCVGRLDHLSEVLGPVVTLGRDLSRFVVPLAELRTTQHAEVDGPAVRDIAHGVNDLSDADLLEVLPIDQHLLATWIDVHHGGMVC